MVELLRILVLEGQVSADHGVEDDAAAPDVGAEAEVALALYHFGGSVARAAACSFEALAVLVEVAQAKIDYFYVVVVVQQQILGLQVPVDDAQLVDVFYAGNELLVHFRCLLFLEPAIFDDMLE